MSGEDEKNGFEKNILEEAMDVDDHKDAFECNLIWHVKQIWCG